MSVSNQTPWHLWLVGTITLLWNAMGALDYYMSQTKNEAYMSMFTPEQLDFFTAFHLGPSHYGLLPFGVVCWDACS